MVFLSKRLSSRQFLWGLCLLVLVHLFSDTVVHATSVSAEPAAHCAQMDQPGADTPVTAASPDACALTCAVPLLPRLETRLATPELSARSTVLPRDTFPDNASREQPYRPPSV